MISCLNQIHTNLLQCDWLLGNIYALLFDGDNGFNGPSKRIDNTSILQEEEYNKSPPCRAVAT